MRWLPAFTLLVLGSAFGQVDSIEGFTDPELDARYRDLIHTIRCMQCQNQSIAESPAIIAGDLRREVRTMMAEGRSNQGIAEALVVTKRAVEKHVTSIFGKLRLPAAPEDHRRVLAVLTFLRS